MSTSKRTVMKKATALSTCYADSKLGLQRIILLTRRANGKNSLRPSAKPWRLPSTWRALPREVWLRKSESTSPYLILRQFVKDSNDRLERNPRVSAPGS